MSPQNTDLIFTIAASLSLIVLFVSAALVLPWTEDELDEVEDAFRTLLGRPQSAIPSTTSVQHALSSPPYLAEGRTLRD
jgi:hypothetical protein